MRKKNIIKKFVGICLVAMMAVTGVGKYAKAGSNTVTVRDIYGRLHTIKGVSTIGQLSGTSYTEAEGSIYCYCTVSADFTWYNNGGGIAYSHGNGAGGMHGAGVTVRYNGLENAGASAKVEGTHTVKVTDGGLGSCTSDGAW